MTRTKRDRVPQDKRQSLPLNQSMALLREWLNGFAADAKIKPLKAALLRSERGPLTCDSEPAIAFVAWGVLERKVRTWAT